MLELLSQARSITPATLIFERPADTVIGVDLGFKTVATLSDGRKLDMPQVAIALYLARSYSLICTESLDVANNAFTLFFETLGRYCAREGSRHIAVGKYYPSTRICSHCLLEGPRIKTSIREWQCKACNALHDRDFNAAKNILREGRRLFRRAPLCYN